jgi:hypothetical protein
MLVLLSVAAFVAGCSSSQETRVPTDPRSYDEAMYMIAEDVRLADKHLIGAQYALAENDMDRVVSNATRLAGYEPPRSTTRYADYTEYRAQADDLLHAADRLRFMVEQRRRRDAESLLEEVARRFNRLSATYGPSYQIGVLERSPNEFRFDDGDRSSTPGELQNNR